MMKNHKAPIKPSEWKRRRLRLDLSLIAILVWLSWIIFHGTDTTLFQQISVALIAGGVALIGQYVFGAVWDDRNYMNTLASLHGNSDPSQIGNSSNSSPGDDADSSTNSDNKE